MTKGQIYQKDIIIINIHTPNVTVPNYIKELLAEPKEQRTVQQ